VNLRKQKKNIIRDKDKYYHQQTYKLQKNGVNAEMPSDFDEEKARAELQ
jgi:hypothetical protein